MRLGVAISFRMLIDQASTSRAAPTMSRNGVLKTGAHIASGRARRKRLQPSEIAARHKRVRGVVDLGGHQFFGPRTLELDIETHLRRQRLHHFFEQGNGFAIAGIQALEILDAIARHRVRGRWSFGPPSDRE